MRERRVGGERCILVGIARHERHPAFGVDALAQRMSLEEHVVGGQFVRSLSDQPVVQRGDRQVW